MSSMVSLPGSAMLNQTTRPERCLAAHRPYQRVIGVEHREAVARDGLDHDGLHLGELLEGVDAAHAQVVGGHVEDDGDVVALVAEPLAEDAAAGHLEHGEVDPRVLQDHACGLRAPRRRPG